MDVVMSVDGTRLIQEGSVYLHINPSVHHHHLPGNGCLMLIQQLSVVGSSQSPPSLLQCSLVWIAGLLSSYGLSFGFCGKVPQQGTSADNIPYDKKLEGAKKGSQKSAESRHAASERRHAEHPESYGSS